MSDRIKVEFAYQKTGVISMTFSGDGLNTAPGFVTQCIENNGDMRVITGQFDENDPKTVYLFCRDSHGDRKNPTAFWVHFPGRFSEDDNSVKSALVGGDGKLLSKSW